MALVENETTISTGLFQLGFIVCENAKICSSGKALDQMIGNRLNKMHMF